METNAIINGEHRCLVCKKTFYKKLYKQTQAVYCSPKCAYKGRSLGFTKRRVVRPYNCFRKPPKTCEVCQEEFVYTKKTQKYCSRGCFEVAHKQNMLGKKNPAYINGSSYEKRSYRGDDWETIRKEIYERDGYTCCDCGTKCISKQNATKQTSVRIIQCHHIEKYKKNKNNTKGNLITLCLKCHLTRHNQK